MLESSANELPEEGEKLTRILVFIRPNRTQIIQHLRTGGVSGNGMPFVPQIHTNHWEPEGRSLQWQGLLRMQQ